MELFTIKYTFIKIQNTDEYYCPIVITIDDNNTKTAYDGTTYDSMTAFETAVETALNDADSYKEANVDPADTVSITWA